MIRVEFGGGIESLFNGQKSMEINSNSNSLGDFILEIAKMCSKAELFIKNDKIRPGILVLVNDEDWEILGMEQYNLVNKDTITFISTLHGG